MYDYTLSAYTSSSSGSYFAGTAELYVIPVKDFKIVDADGSFCTITVCCPEAGSYTLYIAGYNALGKFEKLYIVPLEFKRGMANTLQSGVNSARIPK